MGDASDIKAGDTAPADQSAGWIGRHWRGELPLDVAFWRNGYLVNLGLGAVACGLDVQMDDTYDVSATDIVFLMPIISVFQKWLMAWGCWGDFARCAYADPRGMHQFVAGALFAFTSAVTAWQVVGIWRSAVRYHLQMSPPGSPDRRYPAPELVKLLMIWWGVMWLWQLRAILY